MNWYHVQIKDAEAGKFIILLALIFFVIAQLAADRGLSKGVLS
jgi:hypothetical protein